MKKINDGGPAFPQILGERYEPMSTEGMSLRAYAAIKLKQPDSGIDWLDKMIADAKRDELSAKAMQTMAVEYDIRPDIYDMVICGKAYAIAEAMIEARLK